MQVDHGRAAARPDPGNQALRLRLLQLPAVAG